MCGKLRGGAGVRAYQYQKIFFSWWGIYGTSGYNVRKYKLFCLVTFITDLYTEGKACLWIRSHQWLQRLQCTKGLKPDENKTEHVLERSTVISLVQTPLATLAEKICVIQFKTIFDIVKTHSEFENGFEHFDPEVQEGIQSLHLLEGKLMPRYKHNLDLLLILSHRLVSWNGRSK